MPPHPRNKRLKSKFNLPAFACLLFSFCRVLLKKTGFFRFPVHHHFQDFPLRNDDLRHSFAVFYPFSFLSIRKMGETKEAMVYLFVHDTAINVCSHFCIRLVRSTHHPEHKIHFVQVHVFMIRIYSRSPLLALASSSPPLTNELTFESGLNHHPRGSPLHWRLPLDLWPELCQLLP